MPNFYLPEARMLRSRPGRTQSLALVAAVVASLAGVGGAVARSDTA